MTVLAWLGHALTATAWFAFHLLVASGLYLLSANVATQPGAEAGAVFVRLFATFWLYVSAWKWVVRGLLARPEPPADRSKKPSGADLARGSLGCLANLVPLPFLYAIVGTQADRAWAGLTGPDPNHPARLAATRGLAWLSFALDHAHEWLPGLFALMVAMILVAIVRGKARNRKVRRGDVQSANAETLAKLRARRNVTQPRQPVPTPGQARVSSAPPPPPRPGVARQDAVLGQLTWSSAESAWWVQREEGFPVLVSGTPDGPDPAALTQAHQVVQRSFEVLLRASEAARAQAQARGVGLPRFTVAAAHVSGKDTRLHLRCDSDATHEYVVRSTDGLHSFAAST